MGTFDTSFIKLIEISINNNVRLMFYDIFVSVFVSLLTIVFALYLSNLTLSFLKNI